MNVVSILSCSQAPLPPSVVTFGVLGLSGGGLGFLRPSDIESGGELVSRDGYACVIPIRSKAACHLIGFVNALVNMSAAIASVLQ